MDLDSLRRLARSMDDAAFARRFPYGFLYRAANAAPAAPVQAFQNMEDDDDEEEEDEEGVADDDEASIGFTTRRLSRDSLKDFLAAAAGAPLPELILAIEKRPGSPYHDRVSIGRAKNCDVVFRSATISKLHAHFMLEDGQIRSVVDHRSANGTYVNGRRVTERAPVAIYPGDTVRFGMHEFEYAAPERIYELLRGAR